jgi:uncharacterized protein YidB (DUF937 family)
MGLFDQFAGQALGALGGQPQGGQSGLLDGLMSLVNHPQMGGLQGLIQKFQNAGLGEQVASWIGTGSNLPISAEHVQQVLGGGHLEQLAQQAGMDQGQAAQGLSQLIPQMVDHLTPNGQMPESGDLLGHSMNLLKGKLFG